MSRKEKDDLELQASELKQKLNLKNTELSNLHQGLQEKNAICSLNELKIQQVNILQFVICAANDFEN